MEPFAPVFIAFDYIYMYITILVKRHVFIEILCDHLEYSTSFILLLKTILFRCPEKTKWKRSNLNFFFVEAIN